MPEVTESPTMGQFAVASGDAFAFVEQRREGDRIVLTHTEVPEALSGKGIGSILVHGVLDALRAERAKVEPRCEFVAAYIERHPEYQDLLADRGGAAAWRHARLRR